MAAWAGPVRLNLRGPDAGLWRHRLTARRWEAAAAAGGPDECYTAMEALVNGWLDAAVAVVRCLPLFGSTLLSADTCRLTITAGSLLWRLSKIID